MRPISVIIAVTAACLGGCSTAQPCNGAAAATFSVYAYFDPVEGPDDTHRLSISGIDGLITSWSVYPKEWSVTPDQHVISVVLGAGTVQIKGVTFPKPGHYAVILDEETGKATVIEIEKGSPRRTPTTNADKS